MFVSRFSAFTLIELLIVVAIIAILAAIAVPNFLEAQVRAKVSREKANMRSIAVGLEAYHVDNNHYPLDPQAYQQRRITPIPEDLLFRLSTPVAFMTSVPKSIFNRVNTLTGGPLGAGPARYFYNSEYWLDGEGTAGGLPLLPENYPTHPALGRPNVEVRGYLWGLNSIGPDQIYNHGVWAIFGIDALSGMPAFPGFNMGQGALYDATNGTISAGDIVRLGP